MDLVKVAKNHKVTDEETFKIGGKTLVARTFTTRNSWGHYVMEGWERYIAKIIYYNRTWESYRYETVLRKACANIGILKEFEEFNQKKKEKEKKDMDELVRSFEELYKQTSPTLKEKLKTHEMHSIEDVNSTKMLMAFDILLNQ